LEGELPVKLEELKHALRTVDPGAVLVSQRLLARVIQEVHRLPTQFPQVPHQRSFVIDRQVLFRHVEQDELDLDPDRLLPPTVLLLVRPSAEEGELDRAKTLQKYWQLLFHACIDRALDQRIKAGKLTAADLAARVAAIGDAEFDEIRSVLARDHWLLPPVDDLVVYCEFVAVYLELRHFLPNLRSVYFPAIGDMTKIDSLIDQDIDGEALWKATRLPGAPDPNAHSDSKSDDSHDYYWKLVSGADTATKARNHVRAAILRMKAARVAPGAKTLDTRRNAELELKSLADRLKTALLLTDAEAAEWHDALKSLLEKADQGPWTVEARLLYDLQQVCIDAEREVFKLDLVEWVLSLGRRPIKRPLPSQRLVQMTRHLHEAAQRIPLARLSDADRQHLTRLMQSAQQASEQQLRVRFRPIFADALNDAGLAASNPPEETAFRKMIEELLDRITAVGFFTFSDLRDAISRNSLKMADLADPQEFVRGDPLLRLDRRLASLLDGVYRSGEVYLRVLEWTTSLLFGTKSGRFLTTNVLLPFGGSLAVLFGLQHFIAEPIPGYLYGPQINLAPLATFIPVGLFILALMHLPKVRDACIKTWQGFVEAGRLTLKAPVLFVRMPPVQRVLHSWLFQLLWCYVLKPLPIALLIWWYLPDLHHPVVLFALAFAAVAAILNSRAGRAVGEIVMVGALELFNKLRSGLIAGLVRLSVQLLKRVMDGLEQLLYSIDEWLRFRAGDTPAALIVRTVLGVLWYPISFFTRFYVIVFVEPMFHPLKLPIAILAAKFVYPFFFKQLTDLQVDLLSPLLGEPVATVIAVVNTWLSPDLFGFLFWELRENWRLYRANRSPVLRPVMVGMRGETVLHLLRPGFHSGTVPRLFEHLRHAERAAMATGQWRTARAYRQQLLEVQDAIKLFVERELLVLLHQSRAWQDNPLTAGKIELATHLIRVELNHDAHPEEPVRLAFAEKAGWLTVQIEHAGWLHQLPSQQAGALTLALAGWYKLAGVDVVREQVQAGLAGRGLSYVIEPPGLALHSVSRSSEDIVYPINDTVRIDLFHKGKEPTTLPIVPPVEALIFARIPIRWDAWVDAWLREQHGQAPHLLPAGLTLVPAERNGQVVHAAAVEKG
jgi:hypothetical protein